ncbi:MAG: FkbM family methyltransferase [Acidobacteria bacterium]|nr:FkbM family methyltransferase [Acidobacteriota bacterium]
MKALFVMRHSGYVRNFESTLRMLCDRGHRVHVAFQKDKNTLLDPVDTPQRFADRYANFSYGEAPVRTDGWGLLGRELRLSLDYLRYLRPEYRDASKLRDRAAREVSPAILARAEYGFASAPVGRRALGAWLRVMDRAIPRDPAIDAFIAEHRPDVMAVTPLIEPGSPQADFVRSAHALGVRSAHCVASWDNLTNKGLIHGPVDLVAVWNEAMKREAVELHGIPADRVVVTGAAAFDHWFEWRPSRAREAFCSHIGLPSDRPYLLYVCSSKFVAPDEAAFVQKWAQQVRCAPFQALRAAGILVRPHPQHAEQWQNADLSSFGGVVVWPPAGAAPVDADSRSDYFDSMYHSAGVVGVNTTAEIESAILGRRVFTLLAPEFRDTQEGTLHFRHLRSVNGGLVRVARDFDEHLAHLDAAVREPDAEDVQCRRFVEAFVRPYGVDVPATPRLVEALEALAAEPARAGSGAPIWAPLIRPRLSRRAGELEREARAAQEARAAREAEKAAREARRRARVAERLAAQARKEEERRARRAEALATRRDPVQALAADFAALGSIKRRELLRAVMHQIPRSSFVDMHAASRPRRVAYEEADIYIQVLTKGEEFRLRACKKEPFTVDWIHTRIGAGEVLYDIGANVGIYSLVAAKKPGGAARVFSFEASYASVASLCTNIVLNGVGALITPMPVALADTTAMDVFSLRDLEPGAARHVLGPGQPEDGPTLYQQPVMRFRLDDLVEWVRLPLPNHIKLDVDGGELAVLEGAPRTLSSPALQSILVEVSTAQSGAVTDVLECHGLRLDSKIVLKTKAGEYAVWYGVFTRSGGGKAAP